MFMALVKGTMSYHKIIVYSTVSTISVLTSNVKRALLNLCCESHVCVIGSAHIATIKFFNWFSNYCAGQINMRLMFCCRSVHIS